MRCSAAQEKMRLVKGAALGLLERSSLDLFEPVAEVTVGWLMFVLDRLTGGTP